MYEEEEEGTAGAQHAIARNSNVNAHRMDRTVIHGEVNKARGSHCDKLLLEVY